VLILARHPYSRIVSPSRIRRYDSRTGIPVYQTVNKDVMISVIQVLMLIYAAYVLFHGEVSLGGGFQAGAPIGMTYLLDVMVCRRSNPLFRLTKYKAGAAAGLGPFIYALTGAASLISGGAFLEYNSLPLGIAREELHSAGMTAVEIGVTIGVSCTIITILCALSERITFDDER
jgi:multicomponent Na+:H+ antiporter subunit B